ncbi:Putative ABC transporter, ATP-binding protein [Plesiocystis pacifica SIR-1]|uniref:Putative ABC transporter, ATP-binding protein n=1 Tax=Plesiocystis pacifica SIR-1 TaxID=391625 RepID=A6GCQ7_9BACT|nr:ABC transporter ATP-binding protein [Plesiocystis pacifica]EDM76323.1 Putative ABC transporter, ATP-binding protein [Plesiocystis pacifica SIR-1]
MTANADLDARGLRKAYAGTLALAGVDLHLDAGTHACIMGASGSGKTTLLRILAGLESADAGELRIAGRRVDTLPPERRPTRSVFQTPTLFPHLSVLDNLRFVDGLRASAALPPPPMDAEALLDAVGLDPSRFGARSIDALSGGERQRVALARALYRPPPWLLLDEPLSAVDSPRRSALRRTLAQLRARLGLGMIHVTHAAGDALALADRLLIFDAGELVGAGAPRALYARPPNLVSARLLGELSPLPGAEAGRYLRPEHLELVPPERGRVRAKVLARTCSGPLWTHELALVGEDSKAHVLASGSRPWEGADSCGLDWRDEDVLELR